MSLLSKHDWKQSRSVLDVWLCTLHCTLGSGHSGAGHNFPSLSQSQREASWHPGPCAGLYCAVLYCTLHYCTVLSDCPLCPDTDSLPRSLRAEARTGSDIREEGELPGPVIRGQLRPWDSPSLFPLWSKLPQLSPTASLKAQRLTDGELK